MSRVYILVLIFSVFLFGRDTQKDPQAGNEGNNNNGKPVVESGYRIDEPGTITFTVGVKIKGKVEKPQVMIFLPKEQSVYKEFELDYSFSEEVKQPLPFTPIAK